MQVSGTVKTALGSIYINKLCKHFTHRVTAEWDQFKGTIHFDIGQCVITASQHTLTFICKAESKDELNTILEVVKSHFDRFAIKDQLELNWQTNS